jgi:hypothetical protein
MAAVDLLTNIVNERLGKPVCLLFRNMVKLREVDYVNREQKQEI